MAGIKSLTKISVTGREAKTELSPRYNPEGFLNRITKGELIVFQVRSVDSLYGGNGETRNDARLGWYVFNPEDTWEKVYKAFQGYVVRFHVLYRK